MAEHNHGTGKDEYSEFHIDMNNLLKHVLTGTSKLTPEEDEAMGAAQHPDVFLVCCIDSRFQPDKALDYGPGVTLEYRPISAVIPPPEEADAALNSRMAFRRLKDVRNFVIIAHSDCGGAQAAINIPNPDLKTGGDLDIVANEAHRTGLDIAKISPEFLKAANGDVKEAGNHLAHEIGVQSLKNLLQYKGRTGFATIADEIKAGEANAVLLFYDLDTHKVDKYDLATNTWSQVSDYKPAPNVTPPAQPPKASPPPAL
jgi:carbonic anhydrase